MGSNYDDWGKTGIFVAHSLSYSLNTLQKVKDSLFQS